METEPDPTSPEPTSPDLATQTFLVTGATSGIGRSTALALGRRGARVLLACRSAERALDVRDEVVARGGTAEHVPLDLADLASVRSCAKAVTDLGEPVHVLVNNAGVAGVRGATAQGFELAFGVNHLGHFLLTTLLLDQLGPLAPRRVVTLSSKAHNGAKGIDFAALRRPTRTRTGLVEYQVAKLCNVLFTQELALRHGGAGVDAYAVHPGFIASDIWQPAPRPFRALAQRLMASPDDGAVAPVHAATAAEVGPNGSYLDRREVCVPGKAVTAGLAADLWRHSEDWVG